MALRGLARSWRCALQGAAAHTQQCAATAAASCSARRAASGAPASPSAPETSSGGASPSVFDRVVQIFVIDKAGVRHTVRGLVGQTLAAALSEYPAQFPSDSFMPHPYDPAYPDCHCYIQGDYLDRLTPLTPAQEQEQAELLGHHVRAKARDNSRLGYYITLSPALNGMTVALGEVEPWEVQ